MASTLTSTGKEADRTIKTAACLIIGDEILGGKILDQLKKIETIEDEEDEVIDAVKRLSSRYDFVITSGGIGPTHDDITYSAIAKAFGLPLKHHEETYRRMKAISKPKQGFSWDVESEARTAKLRMANLPFDESRELAEQALFPCDDLWVPVSVVNGNIYILPGVPDLFVKLAKGLWPIITGQPVGAEVKGLHRIVITTPFSESEVAKYLTDLAEEVRAKGVRVGSYSEYQKDNSVTLTGYDIDYMEGVVPNVIAKLNGKRVVADEDRNGEPKQP
ncbi:hypothetical protein ONZ43_g2939 [Nemania bipapillata]|uniref:Uncharacterized protein n=1 Tax=Nemania bipapillata TaxID=110536 RepID=A0ACC2IYS0_9PEZI|nr:hypothetical protein ONZ43_g2939 [Nemania bipapillata]